MRSSKDDRGNETISNVSIVRVKTGEVPTVAIDSPAETDSFYLGDLIEVEITAGDSDGFLTQVLIYNGDTALGFAQLLGGDEYRYTLDTKSLISVEGSSVLAVGTINLMAEARDNSGNVVTSDFVAVDLQARPAGEIPTVDSFTLNVGGSVIASGGSFTSGESLEIIVAASDTAPGTISYVEIFNNDVWLRLETRPCILTYPRATVFGARGSGRGRHTV